MAAIRVPALYAEAIFASGSSSKVTKQAIEAAINNAQANTSANLKVPAYYGEVAIALAFPQLTRVMKQAIEAAVNNAATNTAGNVQVAALYAEALFGVAANVRLSKQAVEVLIDNSEDNTVADIRIPALYGEALVARGPANPVPLTDPTGLDLFVHNWASQVQIRTAYMTDIVPAQNSMAEERRALWSRPIRHLRFDWLQNDPEWLIKLRATLIRLPNERLCIPLYQDQMELTASSAASDTLFGDTTNRRLFVGGRVAIVKLNQDRSRVDAMDFRRIIYKADAYLQVDSPTSFALSEASVLVFPTMDTEVNLKAGMANLSEWVAKVELELAEVIGPSALPPLTSAVPVGVQSYGGYPIFDFEHDWAQPFNTQFVRDGRNYTQGRGEIIDPQGATHRLVSTYEIGPFEREEFMRFVAFFDYCQGRLKPFWLIDQENDWTLDAVNGGGVFLDFETTGDFDDFVQVGEYVGIVLKDGTRIVRHADNVEDLGSVYRITLDSAVTFTAGDERLIARARVSRFNKDELTENWTTDGLANAQVEITEVLEEKDVDLG